MTAPEVRLWQVLRARPGGHRFRRQHPIGRYVLDFYCPAARVAIEVDGMAHDMGDGPVRDAMRDAWLTAEGIGVLRFAACDVMREADAVLRAILDRCAIPLHHPTDGPPPHAAHGEE